jgi:tRNA pseudouridine55 synthase
VVPFTQEKLEEVLYSLKGELPYYPPKFCAKRINGKRAYELARAGEKVDLKTITSNIYDIKLINYNHPFVHFEATVSEGTYIRSLGSLIADKLNVDGTLSSLHRIHEGQFYYNDEKALDPFTHLALPSNIYTGDESYMEQGKKLTVDYFETKEDDVYLIETSNFFSIIEIANGAVAYRFNRIPKF